MRGGVDIWIAHVSSAGCPARMPHHALNALVAWHLLVSSSPRVQLGHLFVLGRRDRAVRRVFPCKHVGVTRQRRVIKDQCAVLCFSSARQHTCNFHHRRFLVTLQLSLDQANLMMQHPLNHILICRQLPCITTVGSGSPSRSVQNAWANSITWILSSSSCSAL